MSSSTKELKINTEYITLDAALKFSGIAMTGGEAKIMILEENVSVNGEICTMRGKKLRKGDTFDAMGESFIII
ncbi:MAG: RNA-binding S4 domain-containing protein [Clostridiales bacterium]|jgi:ribosome-associated protein|nr:RNA-binding S4 domain-containing protein [Clostridiales bacterium]